MPAPIGEDMISILLLVAAQAADPGAAVLPDPLGRETEPQAEAHAAALHKRMDANGDGYVTPAEIARLIEGRMNGLKMPGTDAAHPLPPQAAAIFAAADTDHDGRESLAEVLAAVRRDFMVQDTNHDGVVTPDERMAFIEKGLEAGKMPERVPFVLPRRKPD